MHSATVVVGCGSTSSEKSHIVRHIYWQLCTPFRTSSLTTDTVGMPLSDPILLINISRWYVEHSIQVDT